ncbi:non-ribosomal peptide synthetase [Burkholderia sp. Ac-20379]|uniref:non-ribosomal peptide synthetase n=1 Tax=Burkholderia sp. Ac-20379 TaxID=2703900 RepID=UPI001981A574|nr:non-ribosomal peptide synthetase [Burkholderia sp. Ac-20379]MBN3724642.1 amino acid adenylation domain-containing protein [Burkholderia sp. Ac-20379]
MNDFSSGAMQAGYPLSQQQRAALADAGLAKRPVVFAARLDGPRDEALLREAFHQVVARHEILRTAFVAVDGYTGLRQHPQARSAAQWTALDGAGEHEALAAVLDSECALPFDPAGGLTLRAVLVSIDARRAVLVWIASHLAADAGSLAMLHDAWLDECARRLGAQAAVSGGADEDDEGVLDYGQYVEWREELGHSDDAPSGKAYWAERASADVGSPTVLALPYRRPGRHDDASASPLHAVARPVQAGAGLAALAARLGTRVEVVTQAAWWALVGRIADAARVGGHWQNDCRRDYAELAGAIGPFEAVLPISLDVRPDRTFRAIAAALATTLEAHREVQEYCAAQPVADATRGGIAFRFDKAPAVRSIAGSLTSTPIDRTIAAASFDLVLGMEAGSDDVPVRFQLHHATAHYPVEAAEALLDQYATLLEALLETGAVDMPIASLAWVGEAERGRLLGWQGAAVDFGTQTLSGRLGDFARRQPDAPALSAPDLSLTYGELEQRVAAAAVRLAAAGASRERPVAIALQRSGGLVVALLAAMRAGAPYLPLDPEWPAERRARILERARPAVTIVADVADEPASISTTLGIADLLAAPAIADGVAPVAPSDGPAYLLFTSGSTGEPKGVPIGQRQLLNYALAVSEAAGFDASRRFALTSTVAADLGNTTLFGALAQGACLVVATTDDMRDGDAFARFVREQAIDCVKIVPSHLEALLDTRAPALPPIVVLGGEAAGERLLARIAAIAPATRIVNHYGPTETTVGVAVHRFDRDASAAGRYASGLPLTAPLANCRLRVLDAQRRLVPTGATGELYIGGAQLCDAYLGGERGDAFIDDPFVPGERLYRSGDLARVEPEGGVRILGRVDDQVKIRGFRIEIGDVEAALRRRPEVQQAAVRVARRGGDNELVAFVVPSGAAVTVAALKAALRERLPDAMVPARIALLADLPRLPNGKIDRQALTEPSAEHAAPTRAPSSSLETLLMQTAATLLERESIGVDDDFFALGGHSLLVIRFVTRVQDLLRVELLPGTLFEHPTIAALARALLEKEAETGKLEKVAALRLKLAAMTPEAREALLAKARDTAVS